MRPLGLAGCHLTVPSGSRRAVKPPREKAGEGSTWGGQARAAPRRPALGDVASGGPSGGLGPGQGRLTVW